MNKVTYVLFILIATAILQVTIQVCNTYVEEVEIPYKRGFEIQVDFKVSNFTFLRPCLEVYMENLVIKVYLNEKINPISGIYLLNNSKLLFRKPLLLSIDTWYRLSVCSIKDNLRLTLMILNKTYIATKISTVSPLFSQGLTYDGSNWYFTGTSAIYKLTHDMKKLLRYNDKPIPKYLREEGYFHLGDLDHYMDLLLIPIEKVNYEKPTIIAIYNSTTLKLVRYSYTPQNHMPWIAIDSKGYIYTSEFSPVDEVYVYHIDQIKIGNYVTPLKVIKLKRTLTNVQGGAILGNSLILTSDDGDHVYRVNLKTGEVSEVMKLPGFYEMEGVEVIVEKGKPHIVTLVNTHEESNVVYSIEEHKNY